VAKSLYHYDNRDFRAGACEGDFNKYLVIINRGMERYMKGKSDINFEKRKNLAKSHYEKVKRTNKKMTRMFLIIFLLIVISMIILYFQSKWIVPSIAIIIFAAIMTVSFIIKLNMMEKTAKNVYEKFENKTIKL
jgi:hypothetical protein